MTPGKQLFPALALILLLTLPGTGLAAGAHHGGAGGPARNNPPFLITGGLPHLTMLLKKQWDNPELALTAEQKQKLLAIRRETMDAVARIRQEIAPLEQEVISGIMAGTRTPEELRPLVRSIGELKAEATMVHLRCIRKTGQVLDSRQSAFLLRSGPGR